jgi:putative SOS response-associated peptidase YedK
MALAGIWDSSVAPGKTAAKLSFCVLTTVANRQLAAIQRRMPVILDRDQIAAWLDPKMISGRAAAGMICSYPAERMEAWPVSSRVNNLRSNDAGLIEPMK